MDDTRTQEALDELADLFLTGNGPVVKASNDSAVASGETSGSASEGASGGASGGKDLLEGPAPIRLAPKLTGPPRVPVQPKPRPSLNESPPLRLQPQPDDASSPIATIGEPQGSDQDVHVQDQPRLADEQVAATQDDPPVSVAVEAVILGNLPGLSGPWLTQYAQLLAQEQGPVAILHVDDDLIDIELVESTTHHVPDRGMSFRMPPGGGGIDPVSVLDALLDSPGSAPTTVLVHLDPQNDKQGLARAMAIEDWTLMCGADDAAVVGGYRQLKVMVEQEPIVARKRVGLMIMGSDPKESQEAARKIQTAAQNFLKTPVQLLGWQKQMVPVSLRHLGRFEGLDTAWPRLAKWFDRHAAAPDEAVSQAAAEGESAAVASLAIDEPAIETAPLPEPKLKSAPESVPAKPVPAPSEQAHVTAQAAASKPSPSQVSSLFTDPTKLTINPRRVAPPATVRPAQPVHPTQPKTSRPKPEPSAAPKPATSPQPKAVPDQPDLAELLMATEGAVQGEPAVPGGIALEARCPHQPQTQLLLDQHGQLHLLRRHDSQAGGVEGLQPAMVDLLQARKWVCEHLSLLELTQRQLRFDAGSQPVLHLFTDRADWATALATRLGDALKLHLLQDVQVGDQRAWFCTPLN